MVRNAEFSKINKTTIGIVTRLIFSILALSSVVAILVRPDNIVMPIVWLAVLADDSNPISPHMDKSFDEPLSSPVSPEDRIASQQCHEPLDKGFDGYIKGDFRAALREWLPSAESGCSISQWHVGILYENGLYVEQSYEAAAFWYRLSADQGDLQGIHNLQRLYEDRLIGPLAES